MEPVQTHLINDVITVQNSGIDWVALFALAISIFALWLQHHVRKKDLVEQRKNADADEKMRKWSAAYPYKLKLFTDFYDVLFRFVNYKGSPRQMPVNKGKDMMFVQIHVADLQEFYSQINRICEECKVLFPGEIESKVHKVYEIMNNFMYAKLGNELGNMFDSIAVIENNTCCLAYNKLQENLERAQNEIRQLKLEDGLRNLFRAALQAPEGGDQCQK